MSKNQFIVMNEQGEEVVCDILFTFDSDETQKSYIVYTDNTKVDFGNVNVMAAIYDPTKENPRLEGITSEKEWNMIETILSTLQEEVISNQGKSKEEMDEAFMEQQLIDKLDEALGWKGEIKKELESVILTMLEDDEPIEGATITLEHKVDGAPSYIGYHPEFFPFKTMSKLHAALETYSDGRVLLYDMGSQMGTYVNDKCIGMRPGTASDIDIMEDMEKYKSEPVCLKTGDIIAFSPFVKFHIEVVMK